MNTMGAYPYALLEELGYICHPMMSPGGGHYVSVSYARSWPDRFDFTKMTEGWLWNPLRASQEIPNYQRRYDITQSFFVAGSHHENPPIPHELAVLLTGRLEETIDRLANADKNKPKGNQ